jgi:hypothetical protein
MFPSLGSFDLACNERGLSLSWKSCKFQMPKRKVKINVKKKSQNFGMGAFGFPLGPILVSAYLDNLGHYMKFRDIAGGYS